MTEILTPSPVQHFHATDGTLASGYQVYAYLAGTTTKTSTYNASAGGGSNLNTNPILLNSRGEANIWLDATGTYKFVLAPPTDSDPPSNAIWTVDNLAIGSSNTIVVASVPPSGSKGLLWLDTSVTPNALKVYDGSQFVIVGYLDAVNHNFSTGLGLPSGTSAGSATLQTVTAPIATTLVSGQQVRVVHGVGPNTGVAALSFNGGNFVTIVGKEGRPLLAGELPFGDMSDLYYTGTSFRLVNTPSIQGAKAFINFDGSASLTIRGSYNVSSIAQGPATGNYILSFINPMASTAYVTQITGGGDAPPADGMWGKVATSLARANLQSYRVDRVQFYNQNTEASLTSAATAYMGVTIHGG